MSSLAQRWVIRAPSNIALIKYMGKSDPVLNLPENASLSMTLDSLSTYMSLEVEEGEKLRVRSGFSSQKPGEIASLNVPENVPDLKGVAIEKMQKHWERVTAAAPQLLKHVGLSARLQPLGIVLQTANTFPMGSGIASSASSFAALTLAAISACVEDFETFKKFWSSATVATGSHSHSVLSEFKHECAKLARRGSGSSCRSFEGPWVQWEGETVSRVFSSLPEMAHFVVVVSSKEKKVSSSQAHLRVKTSALWNGRVERVQMRFEKMKKCIEAGDLSGVSKLAWSEMWEMHSLFHTAEEPFSYWEPATISALHSFAEDLQLEFPPIVTLDAGPNVHVLVPKTMRGHWLAILSDRFGAANILCDQQGSGAEIL